MDFGKSLCVLCRKPLAQETLIAYPSNCPTHYFHFYCIVEHAKQDSHCPIDRIEFESIVCVAGEAAVSSPKRQENVNQDVSEEPSKPLKAATSVKAKSQPSSGKKIVIGEDRSVSSSTDFGGAALRTLLEEQATLKCILCSKSITDDVATPDGCNHFFHTSCLDNYTDQYDVCPNEGCYKEISHFISSNGIVHRLQANEMKDYRNMITAPENFVCSICEKADLHLHRAIAKPCGHLFHRACITDRVRSTKTCPTCESPTSIVECDRMGPLYFP